MLRTKGKFNLLRGKVTMTYCAANFPLTLAYLGNIFLVSIKEENIMQRYVFDKSKLIKACQPKKFTQVMYDMGMSPSQMITFWYTEPDPEKMLKLRSVTGLNPLDYLIEAGPRYKKKLDTKLPE